MNDILLFFSSVFFPIIQPFVLYIENVIMSNNIVDDKIRKQHVKNIHNQIKANDELVNNMICPKCNSKLVEKNGKYGKFIGCSNFPKCNYIKK